MDNTLLIITNGYESSLDKMTIKVINNMRTVMNGGVCNCPFLWIRQSGKTTYKEIYKVKFQRKKDIKIVSCIGRINYVWV